MKVDKIKKSDVEDCIRKSKGFIYPIAKKLGVDWTTAKKLIVMHGLEPLLAEQNEIVLDIAEIKLVENINNNDNNAIQFFLRNKGKSRGYENKASIEVKNTEEIDISKLTDAEKISYLTLRKKSMGISNE
jgi:hypothetical protein